MITFVELTCKRGTNKHTSGVEEVEEVTAYINTAYILTVTPSRDTGKSNTTLRLVGKEIAYVTEDITTVLLAIRLAEARPHGDLPAGEHHD